MKQIETLFEMGPQELNGQKALDNKQPKASADSAKSRKNTLRRKYNRKVFRTLRKQQLQMVQALQTLTEEHRMCVEIAAACQRQTTEVLNHALEKHALHPVIECVAALAQEIFGLCNKWRHADSLTVEEKLKLIDDEILVSVSVAEQKLSLLEIEKIHPQAEEELNPAQHTVCGQQPTEESTLHGKISRVVQEGIVYRGKILRPAKVCVFCYEKSTRDPLNERNES